MADKTTETLHVNAPGLDARPLVSVAEELCAAQCDAAEVVGRARVELANAGRALAVSIREGGKLIYAAAGSSGLMALADAAEIGGTFGIPSSQIRILMAGGIPTDASMPGDTEDAAEGLVAGFSDVTARDTLIVLSASGSTPYALEAVRRAKAQGAMVVAIANNPDTPLLQGADHAICLHTPPELLAGSTRMGAGTAQKIALNVLSTLMAVELGHVYDGMMVNLVADNEKLRLRALGIVCAISGVSKDVARDALRLAEGRVKPAIVMAACGCDLDAAKWMLEAAHGNLRVALSK
ncbi:N-acetylmuramic acid 6-phosphate etherase [Thioclava sp. A2]|uniref:N-acetylmuramic acid 6-phosphate etherase n=1 Tax=Thioclava sp. FCG-A2 TaxID=3080562 RepID=UPI002953C97E|nr:N-acetylmuramic acid 6-phosphate etherase [Thioclava sp. A2]MDV7269929.1 N-acetylmuramic acid 6-phosphate etherase [Thioclava sp. A2]